MDKSPPSAEPQEDDAVAQTAPADGEARRAVLKRFGRYAAVAPTAMILLASREAWAPPPGPVPPRDVPPTWAGGYD